MLHRVARFAFLFPLLLTPCAGQTSSLTGTVTDTSGGVVPSVKVQLVNRLTGEQFAAVSGAAGVYTIPLLKPGRYDLRIEHAGFKPYRETGVVVETGAASRVDVRLEVGGVTEAVTVEAEAPLLKSESSSVGNVIRRDTIANMPLVGRRAASLARLSGFVVQNGTGSNFTMAGGRGDNTNFTIDGGNAQNILLGVATLTFDPPIDSLEEFNVEISNFKAELGRSGGGAVQMTTRSGTNQWHGSAYEFLRNDALDARNFFAAAKPVLRYNQYGGSFSGPIAKNRTFFFANSEWIKTRSQQTRLLSVPTPAEIGGVFSGRVNDPANGFAAFPNNTIPAARMDPVGRAIAQYYPEPNVAGQPSRASNYRVNNPTGSDAHVIVVRFDHTFSQRDRFYFRHLQNINESFQKPVFRDSTDQYGETIANSFFSWSPTWIHTFSPTTILEGRYAWDRRKFRPITASKGLGIPEKIGLRGTNVAYFPRVAITGLEPVGAESYAYHEPYITRDRGGYQPPTLRIFETRAQTKASDYIRAWRELQLIRRTVGDVFQSVDLLITPTRRRTPRTVDAEIKRASSEKPLPPDPENTRPFNAYGLPTISIPCGFSKEGLPIGLQISGAHFAELNVLALAHAYEQATEWHKRVPPLNPETKVPPLAVTDEAN